MNRPFVFISIGMSLDGKISTIEGVNKKQAEISTDKDRSFMYECRLKADAVMVGGHTLLLDDPGLTMKTEERRQLRTKNGLLPEPYKVAVVSDATGINLEGDFINKGTTKKIIFTTNRTPSDLVTKLRENCDVYILGKQRVDLRKSLNTLYDLGVKTLMVEGGGELNYSLIKDNLVDEIYIIIGNLIIGGRNAPTPVGGEGFTQAQARKSTLYDVIKKENITILKYKIIN